MELSKKKIEEIESVDELINSQNDRIKYISEAMHLVHDQQYLEVEIRKAMSFIRKINSNIDEVKREGEIAKELLVKIEEVSNETKYLEMTMDHMESNLPNRFNRIVSLDEDSGNKENVLCEQQDNSSLTPLPTRRHLDFIETTTPSVAAKPIVHKEIQYLTQSEFNNIPSYMRGRVTYDTVNAFIDKLNKCISDKYTLLHTSKSAIKRRADLDKLSIYKRQECPKTKGRRFITQEDLKSTMGGKIDKHTLNMIPMLRHTIRVQEVRDGGVVRYMAI